MLVYDDITPRIKPLPTKHIPPAFDTWRIDSMNWWIRLDCVDHRVVQPPLVPAPSLMELWDTDHLPYECAEKKDYIMFCHGVARGALMTVDQMQEWMRSQEAADMGIHYAIGMDKGSRGLLAKIHVCQ